MSGEINGMREEGKKSDVENTEDEEESVREGVIEISLLVVG